MDSVQKVLQFIGDHPELLDDEDYSLKLVLMRCDGDSKASETLNNEEVNDLRLVLENEDYSRGMV